MDYLCRHAEIKILASCYLKPRWFKATTCPAIRYRLSRAQNWSTSHSLFGNLNPFGIQNRRTLWQGDNFTVNVLSQSAWQSPVFVCSLSPCVFGFPDFGPVIRRRKKTTTKESPVYPPPFFFLLSQRNKHILNIHKVQKQWLLYLLSYCGWQGTIT